MKLISSVLVFVGCVFGANWALATFGIVPIGFGLMAPAGVYFAGLSFTARDAVREAGGRRWVSVAILVGAALSALLENAQRIALASALAFLLSESADALVYEPLRERTRAGAVLLSNTVGAVVDSAVFLLVAFGSPAFIEGQVIGKLYMTAPFVLGLLLWRRRDLLVGHRRAPARP